MPSSKSRRDDGVGKSPFSIAWLNHHGKGTADRWAYSSSLPCQGSSFSSFYVVSLSFWILSSQTIYASTICIILQSPKCDFFPVWLNGAGPLRLCYSFGPPPSLPSRVWPALPSFCLNPQPQPKSRALRKKAKLINFCFMI